jgi:hypothetical protein
VIRVGKKSDPGSGKTSQIRNTYKNTQTWQLFLLMTHSKLLVNTYTKINNKIYSVYQSLYSDNQNPALSCRWINVQIPNLGLIPII